MPATRRRPAETPPDHVPPLLAQFRRFLDADPSLIRALCARLHLAPHEARTVLELAEHQPATIGDLGKHVGVSFGWASRIVEELHQRGVVDTERSTQDRRVVYVTLAERTRREVGELLAQREALVREVLRGFRPAEHKAFTAMLQRLSQGLERLATPAPAAAAAQPATV